MFLTYCVPVNSSSCLLSPVLLHWFFLTTISPTLDCDLHFISLSVSQYAKADQSGQIIPCMLLPPFSSDCAKERSWTLDTSPWPSREVGGAGSPTSPSLMWTVHREPVLKEPRDLHPPVLRWCQTTLRHLREESPQPATQHCFNFLGPMRVLLGLPSKVLPVSYM